MCGLGPVDGAQPGPSGAGGLSARVSAEEGAPRPGDTAARDPLGLTGGGGPGLDGDVGVVLPGDGEGVPGECRGPGDKENT